MMDLYDINKDKWENVIQDNIINFDDDTITVNNEFGRKYNARMRNPYVHDLWISKENQNIVYSAIVVDGKLFVDGYDLRNKKAINIDYDSEFDNRYINSFFYLRL